MQMRRSSRLAVSVAAVLLLGLYVTPLWRIQLHAPQYPEGLGLRIWVNQIAGATPNDLNSINGLNHYIGMRAIAPGDFPELRLMPWILGGMIAAGLLVALIGRRGPLYVWLQLIALSAVAGMVDFYRWGYTYGHELDEHAAIKVPGMSYQPPLIGSKQLLNFHASSWPDIGAGIAAVTLAIGLAVAVLEWRRARARAVTSRAAAHPGVQVVA
jgi:copper chaperone NosL